jgi:DNA/RNA endonuclease YhcR with UshA esterase domain
MKKITLFISIFTILAGTKAFSQTNITAKDAAKHLNEKVTVCDQAYGGKFLSGSNITLIDIGASHPEELLTLLIKGDDRKKFKNPPETDLKGKKICVTGQIIDYKGKPEIVITDPDQIKVQ